jgi:predicted NBD/HSP70 family sugar kinase
VAQGLIDHALLAISRAAAGFVNVFNPTRIIIGGSFAEAHWEVLHSRIQGEIGDNSFKVPGRRVSVHPAELGGDVSLAGCHPMVVDRIGDPEWERAVAVKSKGDTR